MSSSSFTSCFFINFLSSVWFSPVNHIHRYTFTLSAQKLLVRQKLKVALKPHQLLWWNSKMRRCQCFAVHVLTDRTSPDALCWCFWSTSFKLDFYSIFILYQSVLCFLKLSALFFCLRQFNNWFNTINNRLGSPGLTCQCRWCFKQLVHSEEIREVIICFCQSCTYMPPTICYCISASHCEYWNISMATPPTYRQVAATRGGGNSFMIFLSYSVWREQEPVRSAQNMIIFKYYIK